MLPNFIEPDSFKLFYRSKNFFFVFFRFSCVVFFKDYPSFIDNFIFLSFNIFSKLGMFFTNYFSNYYFFCNYYLLFISGSNSMDFSGYSFLKHKNGLFIQQNIFFEASTRSIYNYLFNTEFLKTVFLPLKTKYYSYV